MKPADIPQGVRAVALEVAAGWGLDEFARGVHALEIANTIMDDREASAKEIEQWQSGLVVGEHIDAAIKRLADRIRARGA